MTDQAPSADHPDLPLSRRTIIAAASLAAIVGIADAALWQHQPGLGLTVVFMAMLVGTIVVAPKQRHEPTMPILATLALLSALVFSESAALWWLPFALGATSLAAMSASGLLPRFQDWFGAIARFVVLAPVRLIADGLLVLAGAGDRRLGGHVLRVAVAWLVPIVCAAVFALLFVAANPVLEEIANAIRIDGLTKVIAPERVVLWGLVAVVTWPLLAPRLLPWAPTTAMQGPMLPRAESLLFGQAAIRNALVVFNAMFVVQTLMDIAYLWGGLRLPTGISYADYAHRGAYPLIVTAMLAAAFVLAAMRRGGAAERSVLIRALVYAFLAQNVWLVVSCLLRLKLYVEAYSLTELRLAAAVWMVLVAAGLVLIVVRIFRDRSNKWLVMANLTATVVALFGMSWVNTSAVIAEYNVAHSHEVTGADFPIDLAYMGDLGPEAIPALDRLLESARFAGPDEMTAARLLRNEMADGVAHRTIEWQNWTWREQRLRDYLHLRPFAPDGAVSDN